MTSNKLLASCVAAMRAAQKYGGETNWSLMIAAIEGHLNERDLVALMQRKIVESPANIWRELEEVANVLQRWDYRDDYSVNDAHKDLCRILRSAA